MNKLLHILLVGLLVFFWGCKKDDPETPDPQSEDKAIPKITAFVITNTTPEIVADIDSLNLEIHADIPENVDITNLQVDVTYSDGAIIYPSFTKPVDFADSVHIDLYNSDTAVKYLAVIHQDNTPTLSIPKINTFKVVNTNPETIGEIDTNAHTILLKVPPFSDVKKLEIEVAYTDDCTLSPPSGYLYNFTNPLNFELSNADTTINYLVSAEVMASDNNQLNRVKLPEFNLSKAVTTNNIELTVPFGTDLSNVLIEFSIDELATVTPESGSRVDISTPLEIIVTSESGIENSYALTLIEGDQDVAIRAFWIPATWHSTFLSSYENIQEGVALAKELNFNTLYACAWSNSRTLYASQTLADNSSYATPEEGLFNNYSGGSGDALTDLVQVAHDNGLKVILWYEYGFMARSGSAPTSENNVILAEHPDWVGIGKDGEACNYNGSDFYFNGFNPEVQQFISDLVMEAVINYDIDGIQGDDRLPAMPRNSGYDSYTVEKYKTEHEGEEPPLDITNGPWTRWRADILNEFWQELYNTVKAEKPNCLVTCSPNPYPWAFDNLFQEWPVWLATNSVEVLSVQCYRSSLSSYKSTINEVKYYFENYCTDANLERLVPGLLLYGSNGLVDPELLYQQMEYNREVGIMGESFFYDVPLENEQIKNVIKSFYVGPALFPDFE